MAQLALVAARFAQPAARESMQSVAGSNVAFIRTLEPALIARERKRTTACRSR